MSKFKITGGKGFHLTFPNGVTLSTQFGQRNYGDNYNSSFDDDKKDYQSNKVEVAAWDSLHNWYNFDEKVFDESKEVKGYVSMEDWLYLFKELSEREE